MMVVVGRASAVFGSVRDIESGQGRLVINHSSLASLGGGLQFRSNEYVDGKISPEGPPQILPAISDDSKS